MCRLLRRLDGPPQLAPRDLFPTAADWLLEGIDSERGIAWRAADSFALRDFLGLVRPEAPPDHSTVSRTRRLIDLETHEAVFTWMLQCLADAGLMNGKTVGDDAGGECGAAQQRAARHR
jgi:transposase